jgi:hypothetical protein
VSGVDRIASLLAAYDAELRTEAETPSAVSVARLGPLRLVTFAGGRGFVTYKDLGGADAQAIQGLVRQAVAHFRGDPQIDRFEWKTRAHDHAPGLHDALLNNGFTADEPEAIMIGEALLLAVDVPLRQDAHPLRFERILATDTRTLRPRSSVDDHAVPMAPLGLRRSVGYLAGPVHVQRVGAEQRVESR